MTEDGRLPARTFEATPAILRASAAGFAAFGVLLGLHALYMWTGPDAPAGGFGFGAMLRIVAWPAAGIGAALMLMTLARLADLAAKAVHHLRRIDKTTDELLGRGHAAPAAAQPTDPKASTGGHENGLQLEVLQEIREALYMDDAQRKQRLTARMELDRKAKAAEVQERLAAKDFAGARRAAEALSERFPESPEAAALLKKAGSAEKKHRLEEADRLAEAAEQAARNEHWRKAHKLASELIEKYPDTPPADFARAGQETLKRNAEIEERRDMEDRYKDLVHRKEYAEALTIAEAFVLQYPDSPQAAVLRDRLPRLREEVAGR